MTDQLGELKARFLQEREQVGKSLDGKAGDVQCVGGRPLGSDYAETVCQEISVIEINRLTARLVEIDAVLARIRTGRYGICDECDEPIAQERLAAHPVASLCIGCKSRQERIGPRRARYTHTPSFKPVSEAERSNDY